MLQNFLFYLFSFGVIVFAIGVVTARSAVYGVLSLVSALCMMAGLFVLLKAFFVAAVLILVYAGAILVLFLFVVMLIDYRKLSLGLGPIKLSVGFAGLLCLLLFTQIFKVIRTVGLPENATSLQGTTKAVGQVLFTRYLLPFELTSFLILAAVVSVVVLAKKEADG
jgi:NADH-quinone oxidoreductase subunit J